jgi:hypothetical protein
VAIDSGDESAAEHFLDILKAWGSSRFFAVDLVRARFERLRGRREQALKLYGSTIQDAKKALAEVADRNPRWSCMLEVINKELGSRQGLEVLRA